MRNKICGRVAAIVLFAVFTLTSCTLLDKLGFDTYDYMSETVVRTYATDSETALRLAPMLEILITDSVELPAFENMSDAIDLYRDAVLRHMLATGYSKYSGNIDLIRDAAEEYPEYQITQIIPANEVEATMYEYFGGDVKITHKDGAIFKYLKKVNAYICNMIPEEGTIQAEITSLDETAKTYRLRFCCTNGEETSEEYFALIIKREDGTLYFKKLYPISP